MESMASVPVWVVSVEETDVIICTLGFESHPRQLIIL